MLFSPFLPAIHPCVPQTAVVVRFPFDLGFSPSRGSQNQPRERFGRLPAEARRRQGAAWAEQQKRRRAENRAHLISQERYPTFHRGASIPLSHSVRDRYKNLSLSTRACSAEAARTLGPPRPGEAAGSTGGSWKSGARAARRGGGDLKNCRPAGGHGVPFRPLRFRRTHPKTSTQYSGSATAPRSHAQKL